MRPAPVTYYTQAISTQEVRVIRAHEEIDLGGARHAYGPVQVVSQFSSYRQVKLHTHETLGLGVIDLPEQVLETDAWWLAFGDELLDPLRAAGLWRSDPNDYGPNWAQQRDAARARDGSAPVAASRSRRRASTMSTTSAPSAPSATYPASTRPTGWPTPWTT